ncbi:SDR family oxidoreductase [Thalassoglobus sp. JC818]|uniref:SDR family NAD(P)-dependent oxidoreductase n=1 Tax=Thalassoglobus sp. JC818 TaxID=3232136 RepID=UPI00345B04D8
MKLEGKSAIVTGGGRGIGRSIALALANEGADVVISARTQAEIDLVASEIGRLGRRGVAVAADVTRADHVEQLATRTHNEFGRIDVLVNNAGGILPAVCDNSGEFEQSRGVWEVPESSWDRLIEANLKSVFLCMKAIIPYMIEQNHGDIINIGSRMGRQIRGFCGGYAEAKHAVIALTQNSALQAAAFGIRVNAVSPGLVESPGQKQFMARLMPEEEFPPMDSAESVAAAVLYLLCDAPKSMTGQSLDSFSLG